MLNAGLRKRPVVDCRLFDDVARCDVEIIECFERKRISGKVDCRRQWGLTSERISFINGSVFARFSF